MKKVEVPNFWGFDEMEEFLYILERHSSNLFCLCDGDDEMKHATVAMFLSLLCDRFPFLLFPYHTTSFLSQNYLLLKQQKTADNFPLTL